MLKKVLRDKKYQIIWVLSKTGSNSIYLSYFSKKLEISISEKFS